MTRRCSHCSNNGHNSRTCPTRGGCSGGVKLFGVRLIDGTIMKKSASMSSLSAHIHSPSSSPLPLNPGSPSLDPVTVAGGYLSDDLAHGMCSSNRRAERKKGVPWTEEEHRLFLIGLHKLGKGDWRGIARNYVTSRTPTQVASHAQKYFIRQTNVGRRKRRSSLFDMSADVEIETPLMAEESILPPPHQTEHDSSNPLPSLNLSLTSDFISMENSPSPDPPKPPQTEETTMETQATFSFLLPFSSPLPIPFPVWPAIVIEEAAAASSPHQVLKPIPLLPKQPANVDALVGMSHLSLVEAREPSPLSLKLLGEPSRQSAFHVKASGRGKTSPIQAV